MRTAFIVAGLAVLAVVVLVAIVAAIGAALPKQHEVSRSVRVAAPVGEVYRVVSDVASAPQWRRGVERVEMLAAVDGKPQFREHGSDGAVTYEVVEDVPAQRFVTRIVDRDLGYSGSWTYAFEPADGGTRLTITERGEVTNVIFRFASRFVFGHTKSIDAYLDALTRRLAAR